MTLQDFSKEFRAHHRLFIWIGVFVLLYFSVIKITGYMAHRDELATAVAQAQVKAEDKAQKAADTQKQIDADAYTKWKSQSDLQVNALRSEVQLLEQRLQDQQNKDRQLAPPELGERINTLIGVPGGFKTAPNIDGLVASIPASQATVVLLDEVVSDRQTIKNLNGIVDQKDQDLNKKQGLLTDTENQVTQCKQARVDSDKAHDQEIGTIKRKATNSKMKWGAVGFVIGVTLKALVTHGVL